MWNLVALFFCMNLNTYGCIQLKPMNMHAELYTSRAHCEAVGEDKGLYLAKEIQRHYKLKELPKYDLYPSCEKAAM